MVEKLKEERAQLLTVLLAGGRSSRMNGQNKALLPWQGSTLLDTIYRRLGHEKNCVINSNEKNEALESYGLPLIADDFRQGDYLGPLAGIWAVMDWVDKKGLSADYLQLCSCDTPFVPSSLTADLVAGSKIGGGEKPLLVWPQSAKRLHPLHGLWSVSLKDELGAYLETGGRKVQFFGQKYAPVVINFESHILAKGDRLDPFANINTPEDYEKYRYILLSPR